ncbi:methyl-accepting chemotaxis protein [Paenibacillus sp. Soil750]|uniref:methyl-accepting chemotaxis protein n=1 Tax=Paenibacillus sp. Soil750 TaxID=1736398 RepID=UPI0006FB6C57|nr:methyl-accepting chemotaxis protein [Paenibacillus sp. Soil750]KRE59863.1 hypothetical protein ASL11_27000 [Paenibacillus sp. Soil750]
MTIRRKLLLGFGVIVGLFLISLSILYASLRQTSSSFERFAHDDVHLLNLANQIRYEDIRLTDSVRGIIIDPGNKSESETYDNYAIQIDNHIKETVSLLQSEEEKQIFRDLDAGNVKLVELETKMMELAASDKAQTLRIFAGDYAELRVHFAVLLNRFQHLQEQHIEERSFQNATLVKQRSAIALVVLACSIIIAVLIALWVTRHILSRMNRVKSKLDELSGSSGDLRERIQIQGQDEIAQLAQSFNMMMDMIQGLIHQVRESADRVNQATKYLVSSSEQTSKITRDIDQKAVDMAEGANSQAKGIEESSFAMGEIAADIQRVADHMSTMAMQSEQSVSLATMGSKSIASAVAGMYALTDSVQHANQAVKKVNAKSQAIYQVIEWMREVADQTNLLALNAAIEAAHAGEHGRGFAVVADEVRKLASQSTQSAEHITQLIGQIQADLSEADVAMDQGGVEVSTGLASMEHAGEMFEKIRNDIQLIFQNTLEVSGVSQQMAAGSEQIYASFSEAAEISKHTGRDTKFVSNMVQKQLETVETATEHAATLTQVANELHIQIQRFHI